jgi:hypothetical protein
MLMRRDMHTIISDASATKKLKEGYHFTLELREVVLFYRLFLGTYLLSYLKCPSGHGITQLFNANDVYCMYLSTPARSYSYLSN